METPLRACPNCDASSGHVRFVEGPFLILKCPSCALVFLGNPPPDDELYDDYYGSIEPDPTQYCADSGDARQRELFAINSQRIAHLKHLKSVGTLLDIGCGRGHFLSTAQQHGYQVYGIDVSERAVRYAREYFYVNADVRSLESLIVSGERFDVVTLWHVLEHFVSPYEVLGQIRQLLNPEGVCIIEVPNLRSLKFMLSRTKWEGGNHPLYHRTFFTAVSLRKALIQSGFSRVQRVRWSYQVPGRSGAYEVLKRALNVAGLDAFLDFVAWR